MKSELAAWNNGRGIDLDSWVGCEGRFALAVGYSAIFWPEFVAFERYVLRKGVGEAGLRSFERNADCTRQAIEWAMNHLHIMDIQHQDCEDIAIDKIVHLGKTLSEIYEAKLRWQFPDRRFVVDFHTPADEEDLRGYQLSFWQE